MEIAWNCDLLFVRCRRINILVVKTLTTTNKSVTAIINQNLVSYPNNLWVTTWPKKQNASKTMLEDIKKGNDKVLKIVYSDYRTPFTNWLRNKYRISTDDAKDIFQHAVVIMYENVSLGKVNSLETSIKSYLYGIGQNLAREHVRHDIRSGNRVSPRLVTHLINTSEIEDKQSLESDLVHMHESLNKLGSPCKDLLQLFYFKKMSMVSIAVLLGYKNAETTKTKKFKCLRRLKKLFKAEYDPHKDYSL
jgi:RNA polymerase sigma factor (sigma-70 family)